MGDNRFVDDGVGLIIRDEFPDDDDLDLLCAVAPAPGEPSPFSDDHTSVEACTRAWAQFRKGRGSDA